MRSRFWYFASMITLLALFVSSFSLNSSSSAAGLDFQTQIPKSNLRVVRPAFVGQSQPLRSLSLPLAREPERLPAGSVRSLRDRLVIPKTQHASDGKFDELIVQDRPGQMNMPAPVANFEGVSNVDGVLPPDTQGDIGFNPATGKKYYVQWVNLSFNIWDVTNPAAPALLIGPVPGNAIWSGSGTICESNNDGDPITQFDHLANRWLMSQFALSFPNDFHQCIAVSATADPTGAWYLYDYQTSTTMMNDYPKFGVWPDGYYMTVNQFDGVSSTWGGAGVAVFERSAMLSGLSARMIYIDVGAETLAYGGMLPSDLDGPAPAAGTPNYFMEWDDSTWLGDPTDTLRIWEFKTDWANPLNTTFGANSSYDPNFKVATSDVEPELCGNARSCIPQPGTAQGLDAISDRLMYRLVYRDFGSHQTLLANHTVDEDGADHAGVHWIELRDTGSGWGLYQDGVYAPDADHRWMASLAMDDSGDIALGFSVSSGATYPSIRYTGRLAADPLGSLPQGEASMIAGSGSQTHSAARWGDYSMMALDPTDGCTFWYTQEYMAVTSSASWQTRVGSFKFPSCTQLATGKLTGTVTDGVNPIEGAEVTLTGGIMTVTDAAGEYALVLPAGDYAVTASKFYYSSDTANVKIVEDQTTVQDFYLALAPTHTVSGVVTDSSTHWPLYARINILGYPDGPVFSDPVTGYYSVVLPEWTYDFSVSAMSGGYIAAAASVPVLGVVTRDFELDADLDACTAPGYTTQGFVQDFETWPLSGWTVVDNTAGGLVWDSSAAYGDGNYTGGSGQAAEVNSDVNNGIPYDTELISPIVDALTLPSLVLSYKANFQVYSGLEALDLDISEDGGSTWDNISHWTTSHGTRYSLPGEDVSVDLTSYISNLYPFPGAEANFQLRWHYYTSQSNPWDWYAQVDQVAISKSCVPIPGSGLVVGAVYDANTDMPVSDPTVEDSTGAPALLIDTTQDLSQPNPIYLINEPEGSSVDLTASALGYGSDTRTPAVVAGSTVRQDFYLQAGLLTADPEQMTFSVTVPAPTDLNRSRSRMWVGLTPISTSSRSRRVARAGRPWPVRRPHPPHRP